MAKAYLVIRIKGQADVPHWANTTLNLLKLEKKYRAIILPVKEKLKNYWIKKAEEPVTKKSLPKISQKLVLKQLMNLQHLCQREKQV